MNTHMQKEKGTENLSPAAFQLTEQSQRCMI